MSKTPQRSRRRTVAVSVSEPISEPRPESPVEMRFEQAAVLEISDHETLKLFSDPLRLQLLRHLHRPHTAKELAQHLGVSQTKLYYHINLLEKHKLITVVSTKLVSGIVEKRYQTVAKHLKLKRELLSSEAGQNEMMQVVLSVIEETRDELARHTSINWPTRGSEDQNDEHYLENQVFQRAHFWLNPEQASEIHSEFVTLIKKMTSYSQQDQPKAQIYGFFTAFYLLDHDPNGWSDQNQE
jgi:DNA-binding transcriptional ArsR family regulator